MEGYRQSQVINRSNYGDIMEEMKQDNERESSQGVAGASLVGGFREAISEVTVEQALEWLS